MSELNTISSSVWDQVQQKIQVAMASGQPLSQIKEFVPTRRGRTGKFQSYTLIVLNRVVRPVEWGANRGVAEQTVEFGITGASYSPGPTVDALETLVFSLVDLFLADVTLNNLVNDVHVGGIDLDASPEGLGELTQPWVTVTLIWWYEFLL